MGIPQPTTEVFVTFSEEFSETPDSIGLTDFQVYNDEKSWSYGAFNEFRDTSNQLDFGWGQLNQSTNQIIGAKVFVVKLRNGQLKKIKIESLIGNVYTFKYANFDGTNEVTKTINKADYQGKTLAYFSLETGNVVDIEPNTGGFDLLYCRYITTIFEPGTSNGVNYYLTGIVQGRGVKVAKAAGIDPNTVNYTSYEDSLQSDLIAIGHDWKNFTGTAWTLADDRVYFVKTANSRVWKLKFIQFGGSISGKTVFEKTDLGIISAIKNPILSGTEVLIYPNPAVNQVHIGIDLPAIYAQRGKLVLIDNLGKQVFSKVETLQTGFQVLTLNAEHLNAGVYSIHLDIPNGRVLLGNFVK
jgi:Secretion system C-terminal sorting domain